MAIKGNKGEQMRQVVHFSESAKPPHTVNHRYARLHEKDTGDRKFTNQVLFAGDLKDKDALKRDLSREYVHSYEIPESLISPETFGDDDFPSISLDFIKGPQLELGNDLPARREDAVVNNRVVKYINAGEARGGTSYIMPKSRIESGDIRYKGVTKLEHD